MPNKTVWIYIYSDENDSDGPVFLVFTKKDAALAHAAESIKGIAQAELGGFEWQEDDENPEKLNEILKSVEDKRNDDALAEWEDYRSEYGHRESVSVIESDIVE